MHERELERKHGDNRANADDFATPGRANATAALTRSQQPSASGILMRKGEGVSDNADVAADLASTSTGTQLPEELREKFEGSLGTDLSSVRVHTGGASEVAASAVSARAFAIGQDVHFGAGQYDPATEGGQHLIAHEVAHTVQQRGGTPMQQNKLAVSNAGDALEVEADRAADAMISGRPASVSGGGLAISRNPGLQHAPPPPPGMITLKTLGPVAAAVRAGDADGAGSIPSPAGLYDKAESNYNNSANHCTNVQAHYHAKGTGVELPLIGDALAPGNHNFKKFAKTAGEANAYCESGAVLANGASVAINMWIPLLQNSQSCWAEVKKAADKAGIDTVTDEDGSTSLDAEGVDEEGAQLKGKDRLVNPKDPGELAPNATPQQKADHERRKKSSAQDGLDGKNIDPLAKTTLNHATQLFEISMKDVTTSRKSVVLKHGSARSALLAAKSKANAKRQETAEGEKTGIEELLGLVDKAYAAVEKGRSVASSVGSFADGSKTTAKQGAEASAIEDKVGSTISGITPGAVAKAILQLDGTIPGIEGDIAACKTRDKNLKGVIDEGAIASAGGEFVQAMKDFKAALEKLKTAITQYEAAHKGYAEAMNQAMTKRGLLKPGEDGAKPMMDVLAKVRIASSSTAAAIAATADVLAAVNAMNGLGAPPQPDVCQLAKMAAAHTKAFGTAPSHVTSISGVLTKREAKLKSYVAKIGI
jgi:hypothetical protein